MKYNLVYINLNIIILPINKCLSPTTYALQKKHLLGTQNNGLRKSNYFYLKLVDIRKYLATLRVSSHTTPNFNTSWSLRRYIYIYYINTLKNITYIRQDVEL